MNFQISSAMMHAIVVGSSGVGSSGAYRNVSPYFVVKDNVL